MSDEFFDGLARALATPMPRRRVLRLLGASLVASSIPGMRPRIGRAANPPPDICSAGWVCCERCDWKKDACWTSEYKVCGWPKALYSCGGNGFTCQDRCAATGKGLGKTTVPTWSAEKKPDGQPKRYDCCPIPDTFPNDGKCIQNCKYLYKGAFAQCGEECCPPSHRCQNGKCVPCPVGLVACGAKGGSVSTCCCPGGAALCGRRCCPQKQRCADPRTGRCTRCPRGTEDCGKACCKKGTYCCDSKKGLCCDNKTGSCCNVGSKGQARMTCCTEPNQCATQADRTGTAPPGEPQVCCPEDRTVPFGGGVYMCCPAGYLSLGGKLVLPAGGGGGLCCRKDKVCGGGKAVTCCSTGSNLVPEFEQICCGGTCRAFKIDPNNCGRCGNVCPTGTSCVNGTCK